MTLEQLSIVFQLVGTLGVIASLIFVGVQIRQDTKTTRVQVQENDARVAARKTGPWKGGSALATMNFWNGANGSRRSIAPRDLMFRLTRDLNSDPPSDESFFKQEQTEGTEK
jgi:hypothetical protein